MNENEVMIVMTVTAITTVIALKCWAQWRRWVVNCGVIVITFFGIYHVAMLAVNELPDAADSLVASEWQPTSGVAWDRVPRSVARWEVKIMRAANDCGVDPALLAAIVTTESSGDPDAIGPKGEIGLVQLMPLTAKEMNVTDRSDPDQSLRGGACYLGKMIRRYGDIERGVAAYNAGPGNLDKGFIPASTKEYGRAVMKRYKEYKPSSTTSSVKGCCVWPTTGGYVSQMPNAANHMAYDMAVVIGTPITASHGGRVVKVARLKTGYGHHVVIAGENGISSLYAHLSHIAVEHGDQVRQGQEIGRSGNTGNSTGPHLHFEILKNGIRVDPYSMIGTPYGR